MSTKHTASRHTEHEKDILLFCRKYMTENGYPPSIREIGAAIGVASTNTVKHYMDHLREQGEIIGPPGIPRAFRLKNSGYYFDKPAL